MDKNKQGSGSRSRVGGSRVVRAGLTGKVVLEPGLEEVSSMDNDGETVLGKNHSKETLGR